MLNITLKILAIKGINPTHVPTKKDRRPRGRAERTGHLDHSDSGRWIQFHSSLPLFSSFGHFSFPTFYFQVHSYQEWKDHMLQSHFNTKFIDVFNCYNYYHLCIKYILVPTFFYSRDQKTEQNFIKFLSKIK